MKLCTSAPSAAHFAAVSAGSASRTRYRGQQRQSTQQVHITKHQHTFTGHPMAGARPLQQSSVCRGYVGEQTPPAGEYHCNDFEWETLRDEAEDVLAQRAAGGNDNTTRSSVAQPAEGQDSDGTWTHDASSWEDFHSAHNSARFFKEKRYLLLEFPVLANDTKPQHVVEIGCGCGSSSLPILKANSMVRITACDVSPSAVRLMQQAASSAGIDPTRLSACAVDATKPEGAAAVAGLEADACLMIFTLSAVLPEDMRHMLEAALQALRPGGVLLFRDYGLYDMPQLRFPESQRLGDCLYRRLDGTLSYFFSVEDLSARAEAAGFETLECEYACVINRNRKNGKEMKRAFVHGVFQKPLTSSAGSPS